MIEAAARSGTLNTVAHAIEQGKEVFAVPGNITSPLSVGCNNLLKQGARPVTSTQDILEIIAPQSSITQSTLPLGSNSSETTIISLLQQGIRDGDKLQQLAKLSSAEFGQTLTMLEINGIIRALGANQWMLR